MKLIAWTNEARFTGPVDLIRPNVRNPINRKKSKGVSKSRSFDQ